MGCGCGGSERPAVPPQSDQQQQPVRSGPVGPGSPGYYWEGPERPQNAPPAKPDE